MVDVFKNIEVLNAIIHDAGEGIIVVDESSKILACNPAVKFIFGYQPEELAGKSLDILIPKRFTNHHDKISEYIAAGKSHIMGFGREIIGLHKDGHEIPLEIGISKTLVDGKYVMTGIVRDITERKKAQEELQRLAMIDPLTEVYNRMFFRIQLQRMILEAERYKHRFALFFFDLNHFKAVNDQYGHAIGDSLLAEVAKRMKQTIRASDILARIGGDEFILIAPSIDEAACGVVAEKIISALQEPFNIADRMIKIGVSVGIAFYPDNGTDAAVLVKNADAAMYDAKKHQESTHVFYGNKPKC